MVGGPERQRNEESPRPIISQVISELRDRQSEIRDYGKQTLPANRAFQQHDFGAVPVAPRPSLMESLVPGDANASLQSLVDAIDSLAQQSHAQQALLTEQDGEIRLLHWQVARTRQGFLGRCIREDQRRSLRAVFSAWASVSSEREAAELAASLRDQKVKAVQERLLRAWARRVVAAGMRTWQTNANRQQRALQLVRRAVANVRNRALVWCARCM